MVAGFRRIVEDYETRLTPPAGGDHASAAAGKAEWERFGGGEIELEVAVRKLPVPDGTGIEIRLNGAAIGTTIVSGGRASFKLTTKSGHEIPAVKDGDRLELASGTTIQLEGVFRPD